MTPLSRNPKLLTERTKADLVRTAEKRIERAQRKLQEALLLLWDARDEISQAGHTTDHWSRAVGNIISAETELPKL